MGQTTGTELTINWEAPVLLVVLCCVAAYYVLQLGFIGNKSVEERRARDEARLKEKLERKMKQKKPFGADAAGPTDSRKKVTGIERMRRRTTLRAETASTAELQTGIAREHTHEGTGKARARQPQRTGSLEGDSADALRRKMDKEERTRRDTAAEQRLAERQARVAARDDGEAPLSRKARNDAVRHAKDAEREAEEAAEEAALQKLRQEKEAEEQAEFDEWKGSFSVEEEGTIDNELQKESPGLLTAFVDHIIASKVVALEELGAHFGLRTQAAIHRIRSLESAGRITGIFDERGKFYYIAPDEMQAVASYIEACGRISIEQLAKKSNDLIRLSAK